jgi:hypothetical protein
MIFNNNSVIITYKQKDMNSKNVLNKILALLSDDVMEFTDAQTADGTILQSPTFDVGEKVEVVSEDGSKTPAPDGEHEISLRDTEGNEVLIKIETENGVIVERENVELEKKMDEEVVDKDVDEKKEEDVEMADASMMPAKGLPNTTDEDAVNEVPDAEDKDPLISLSYRIAEMEKQMKSLMEKFGDEPNLPEVDEETPAADSMLPQEGEVAMSEEEEELPKLDGAPIESPFKFSQEVHKISNSGKVPNSQNNFLSKLYS